MDSQSFADWIAQGNYMGRATQTTIFEMPPDISKVPSLSCSPVSSTYDHFPTPIHHPYHPRIIDEPLHFKPHPTPSDFSSDHDCSPRPLQPTLTSTAPRERTHTTSGRRRAQNRAAQRAFRDRKEKHARDLESQLAALSDKFTKLETSHEKLNVAYDRLRATLEVIASSYGGGAEDEDGGADRCRRSEDSGTLRGLLLDVLRGQGGTRLKSEGA
ncbi:hypothetical protein BDW02DRAFT_603690 [Decorospora gaudefroyi]|uniref:Putative transcription factor kapC n=1 Tax=Decorospora gaudefroyi TaxID=184978 RepID=A0A6A5JXT5_9PLEO|nr:hypothetical protein BDW02DRAFT_603690 [Decorospora gaudefroyi]